MRKILFSCLAVGAIAGGTVSHPALVYSAEPMVLAEADMDGITAGASVSLTTGATVTGSRSAVAHSTQHLTGETLPYGGSVVRGNGVALGTATGSDRSGAPIVDANATGDITNTTTFGKVVNTPSKTKVIAVTTGVAVTRPSP